MPITLYTSAVCPFAQRSRMLLEYSGLDTKIVEIDLDNKPKEFTDVNPLGKVPTIVHGDNVIYESYIINEYLEDEFLNGTSKSVLPKDSATRAFMRIWIAYFDDNIKELFYTLLTTPTLRVETKTKVVDRFKFFLKHAFVRRGKFIIGDSPTLIDFQIISFLERFDVVAKHYVDFDFVKIEGLEQLAEYYNDMRKQDWFVKSTIKPGVENFDRKQFLIDVNKKMYKSQ